MTDDQRKMIDELQNYVPGVSNVRLCQWDTDFLENISRRHGNLRPQEKARLTDIWKKCFG